VTEHMPHDELRESTGAYALGLLTGEERSTFEAHLAGCPECQAEVRAFGRVARGLDHAVDQHTPTPALRARVLGRVTHAGSEPLPDTRVAPRHSFLPYWLAAAASIAAIAVGLHAASLRSRVQRLEDDLVVARAESSALRQDLDAARARSAIIERVTYVLAASDVKRVDLTGQEVAPAAAGRAFWSPSKGLIFSADLPAAPDNRVYHLWVVTRGGPVSAGLLAPELHGGLALVTDSIAAAEPQALAVTLEPAGGVPAPTGPMYLVGKL
jgi:anti-sigma-K factor RskA